MQGFGPVVKGRLQPSLSDIVLLLRSKACPKAGREFIGFLVSFGWTVFIAAAWGSRGVVARSFRFSDFLDGFLNILRVRSVFRSRPFCPATATPDIARRNLDS